MPDLVTDESDWESDWNSDDPGYETAQSEIEATDKEEDETEEAVQVPNEADF